MANLFVPVARRTIIVGSGNLFDLAARELGDATKWYQIAQLNGMSDPFFDGVRELKIPVRQTSSNGGIYGSP